MAAERAIVRVRAPAKINLALQVLGVRPDGYHELKTVFQSIALSDTLTFRVAPGPFRLVCDDPACPADGTNLVWRAAACVWAAAGHRGVPRDVSVRIVKRIPVQAGLGGGSSDGAAAIRALAALWRVRLTRTRARRIAVTLGADVPFFLDGGTAFGVGRGDVLTSQADEPRASVVVIIPPFRVSTRDAFEWWDGRGRCPREASSNGALTDDALVNDNDLEEPVTARHPEIARLVGALRRQGARHAAMSGSGSAVFGLFDRRADAYQAARRVAGRGRRVLVTRTVNRAGYARMAEARLSATGRTQRAST
jgi:4-diphosphocytidyl-2-C-methyl-D-erythritol kinase